MTHLKLFLTSLLLCSCAFSQAKREDIPPQTVVAEIDGRKVTAGELSQFIGAMVGTMPAAFERDPKEFTRQLALMFKLAKLAEQEKIDQKPPFKQRLEYTRASVLMQSLMDNKVNGVPINEDDIQKYYEEHKPDYTQSFTKVLAVSFGADGKPRTEADAKAKIADLRKQAAGGADFLKLIKENSEDPASRDKGGDFNPISRASSLPDSVKSPILLLKPGEYSQPIRQGNSYYLFRSEKIEAKPLSEVRTEVIGGLRQENFGKWFDGVRNTTDVKFLSEDFFRPNPNAAPPVALPPGIKPQP